MFYKELLLYTFAYLAYLGLDDNIVLTVGPLLCGLPYDGVVSRARNGSPTNLFPA